MCYIYYQLKLDFKEINSNNILICIYLVGTNNFISIKIESIHIFNLILYVFLLR